MKNENSAKANSKTMIFISIAATIIITMVLAILSANSGGFATSSSSAQTLSERMTISVIIHIATILPAIPLGGYILWAKKGDALHKMLGKIWCCLMLITAAATIWIGSPGNGIAGTGFSFIHIFTLVTFISVPLAIWSVKHGNVKRHYSAMQGLYIGSLIAGGFAFLPGRILHILAFG